MLTGQKKEHQGVFRFPLLSRSKASGFTFTEVLFVVLSSSLVVGALFYVISTGEYAGALSSARSELQAEVRRAADWITKDVRQAVTWEIADAANAPSVTHIKFRQAAGWNASADTYQLSLNYIEYSYDSGSSIITRNLVDPSGVTLQSWALNNIIQAPFYTRDAAGTAVALNSSDLLTSKKLVVVISGQKLVRGSTNTSAAITAEVKIRNE